MNNKPIKPWVPSGVSDNAETRRLVDVYWQERLSEAANAELPRLQRPNRFAREPLLPPVAQWQDPDRVRVS